MSIGGGRVRLVSWSAQNSGSQSHGPRSRIRCGYIAPPLTTALDRGAYNLRKHSTIVGRPTNYILRTPVERPTSAPPARRVVMVPTARRLGALALRAVANAVPVLAGVDLAVSVADFFSTWARDPSRRLPAALGRACDRAWRALEVALAGEALWSRLVDAGEDKAFRTRVRAFLDGFPASAWGIDVRRECLGELRAARQAGELSPGDQPDTGEWLAEVAETYWGFPTDLETLDSLAADLRQSGYPALARLVALRP